MTPKYFSVKANGITRKLVAFDEKQAIERACKINKCTYEDITKVLELRSRSKTKTIF